MSEDAVPVHKLWVDDEREPPTDEPDVKWIWSKTSDAAITEIGDAAMYHRYGMMPYFDEISLDHDLGGDDTGMKVLDNIVKRSEEYGQTNVWPRVLTIHTMNPVAREQMLATANRYGPPDMEIYTRTHTKNW